MKRTTLYLVLIISLTTTALAQSNLTGVGADVDISLLKYEPIPAQPGDQVEIWIQVENNGGEAKRDVSLEFLDNYPVKLQTGEKRVHNVGRLQGGSDYVAKFRTRIDPATTSGTANIALKYTTATAGYERIFLPLDIKSRITSLKIRDVTTTPKQIAPGQTGDITFTLENIADALVQDVTVKLNLDNSNAPIAPQGSSTEVKVDELPPGEKNNFTFNLAAKYDADPNIYRIPVNITFTNEAGKTIAYDDTVGVPVVAQPQLITTVDASDIYTDDRTGSVTLKFVNQGVDEIKFVTFELRPHNSYELLSPSDKYYVGNIDSDDYEIQEVQLKGINDTVKLPMSIEYSDASNTVYQRNTTLTLNLVSQQEITGETGSNTWIYVAVAIAIIAILWWWRRR